MADKINVLIPEETVDAKIKEIGEQISKELCRKRSSPHLYFKGRRIFACELAKRITVPVSLDLCRYPATEMRQRVQESFVLRRI